MQIQEMPAQEMSEQKKNTLEMIVSTVKKRKKDYQIWILKM